MSRVKKKESSFPRARALASMNSFHSRSWNSEKYRSRVALFSWECKIIVSRLGARERALTFSRIKRWSRDRGNFAEKIALN